MIGSGNRESNSRASPRKAAAPVAEAGRASMVAQGEPAFVAVRSSCNSIRGLAKSSMCTATTPRPVLEADMSAPCADDAHGPQHWYPDAHGRPAEVQPKEDVGPHLPPGGWRAGTSQGSRPRTGLATSVGGESSLLLCVSHQAAPVLSGLQMPKLPLDDAEALTHRLQVPLARTAPATLFPTSMKRSPLHIDEHHARESQAQEGWQIGSWLLNICTSGAYKHELTQLPDMRRVRDGE